MNGPKKLECNITLDWKYLKEKNILAFTTLDIIFYVCLGTLACCGAI